jgi:hypothetical protein
MLYKGAQWIRSWTLRRLEAIGITYVGKRDACALSAPGDVPTEDQPCADEQCDWEARGDWIDWRGSRTAALHRAPHAVPFEAMRDADDVETPGWQLEQGSGGDIDADGRLWRSHPHLPERAEVLSAWLRLHERVHRGEVGGAADGAGLT